MAQMFSSGVTPEYLQSLAAEYAKYFPKQQAVNTEALQQWYSPSVPSGSSAVAAPSDAVGGSSVVGSLFGDQYPQVHQGGGNQQMGQGQGYASPSTQSTGAGLASAGISYGNMLGGMMPYGAITKALGNAYVNSQLSNAAANGGYTGTFTGDAAFGNRVNNVATEGALGPMSGGGFGATQGNNTSGATVGGYGGNSGGNFGGGFGSGGDGGE